MEPKEWYNIYKRTLETLTEQREEYKQVYERLLDAIADFIVLSFDSITKVSKIAMLISAMFSFISKTHSKQLHSCSSVPTFAVTSLHR